MFSGFVTDLVSICIYGLKLIAIRVIDVTLVDRQFTAGQNQDDWQVGILAGICMLPVIKFEPCAVKF